MSRIEDNPSAPSSIYLQTLSFEGVKCFKKPITIDFSGLDGNYSPWTLIIGFNGVGKTTLLRIIQILFPRVRDFILKGSNFPVNFPSPYMSLEYAFNFNPFKNFESFKTDIATQFSESGGKIFHSLDSQSDLSLSQSSESVKGGIAVAWQKNSLVTQTSNNISKTVIFGYGATRHMSQRGLSEDILANASQSLFDDNATLTNTEELYLQTLLRYKNGGTERDKLLLNKVEEIITRVLPDLKDHPAEEKIRAVDAPTGFGTRMEVNTPYGWVPIPELSLGYKTMIAWIVDFASKLFALCPDSPDPLAEPAICLVDEIDLHMHPRWQRDIMDFLLETFPKTQFIVTAHSPLIVQASAKANIVLLKQVGDHVEVENDPEIVEDWRIDQLLTSDLFGLESARSKSTAKEMAAQDALLAKDVRTPEEEQQLQKLNERLKSLPLYDSPEEKKAQSVLDKMIEILQRKPEA